LVLANQRHTPATAALVRGLNDIEPLVRGMITRFAVRFQKEIHTLSQEALGTLQAFPWPGNIRQLENVVQQAVLVSQGTTLELDHLPQPLREALLTSPQRQQPPELLFREREQVERNTILRALQNSGYSRARAASLLGVSRITLYKKMKKYGLMGLWDTPDQEESLGVADRDIPR